MCILLPNAPLGLIRFGAARIGHVFMAAEI